MQVAATWTGRAGLAHPAGRCTQHTPLLRATAAAKPTSYNGGMQHEQAAAGLQQAACLLGRVGRTWYAHLANQRQQEQLPAPIDPQDLRRQMASAGRSCMAVLAAVSLGGGWQVTDLYDALAKAIDIYLFLLTVRVLLTWFRNINWFSEPFRTLRSFTDPALNACRGILPAIGGIDLSPMLLFFGLNFAARQLKIMALSG